MSSQSSFGSRNVNVSCHWLLNVVSVLLKRSIAPRSVSLFPFPPLSLCSLLRDVEHALDHSFFAFGGRTSEFWSAARGTYFGTAVALCAGCWSVAGALTFLQVRQRFCSGNMGYTDWSEHGLPSNRARDRFQLENARTRRESAT